MNKNKFLIGLFTVLCSTALFSCKKETVVNTDGSNLYQPYLQLQIGKYITYSVDSSIWNDALCIKFTPQSQQRFLINDTFRDNQKRLSYVVNVLSRKNDTAQWYSNDVIYITPAADHFEYVEKNIRFMRLANPVKSGATWAGNSLMPSDDKDYAYLQNWNYTYQNVLQPYDNGKMKFDNTITVSETNQVLNNPETAPNDYAYLLQSKSVYAYGVGMVYHEYTYWTYEPNPSGIGCRKGVGVIMRAIDHN
jgi:hypothetical protein